jgi:hypothetical protein
MTIQEDGQPNDAGHEETGVDLNQVDDVDMQALQAAEEEVRKEEEAAAAAAEADTKAEQQRQLEEQQKQEKAAKEAAENATALPPASQTQPASRQAPTSVPTDRFNQVIAERNSEREGRIAAESRLELLSDLVKTGQMTPELADAVREGRAEMPAQHVDPFAEVEAAELALAEKYDKNEINTVQWTKERQALDRRKDDIRSNIQQSRDADALESQVAATTAKIQADFPVLQKITNADLQPLKGMAQVMAVRKLSHVAGFQVAYNPRNPEHVLQYRFELAAAADRAYGDGLGPLSKRTQQPNGQQPGAQPGNGQPPANGAQPPAKPTADQVRNKLSLQQQHPPQTATVRSAGQGADIANLAKRVETMSPEEIDAFDKANPGVLDTL